MLYKRSNRPIKKDFLARALKVQVALEAGSTADPSKPQTCKDLSRLSKAGLEAWIESAGPEVPCTQETKNRHS